MSLAKRIGDVALLCKFCGDGLKDVRKTDGLISGAQTTLNVQTDMYVQLNMGADGGQKTQFQVSVLEPNAGKAKEGVKMTRNVMDPLYVVMEVVSMGQQRSVALQGKLRFLQYCILSFYHQRTS